MSVSMVLSAPALAQDDPTTGNLTTSASERVHGESMAVAGGGCEASTPVDLTIAGATPIGTTTTGANGEFATNVVIPATAPAGAVVLAASCSASGGGTLVLSNTLDVIERVEELAGDASNEGVPAFLPRTELPTTQPAESSPWISGAVILAILAAAVGGLAFAQRREFT